MVMSRCRNNFFVFCERLGRVEIPGSNATRHGSCVIKFAASRPGTSMSAFRRRRVRLLIAPLACLHLRIHWFWAVGHALASSTPLLRMASS